MACGFRLFLHAVFATRAAIFVLTIPGCAERLLRKADGRGTGAAG